MDRLQSGIFLKSKHSRDEISSQVVPFDPVTYWLVLAGVTAVLLAVVWVPAYNSLVDYPVHLARAWVLKNYDATPFFQSIYVRTLDPMPNLAIDLIVPPLLNWLQPVIAGKVFLSLIVLLFVAGCHLLGVAVYGRPTWAAPVASLFVLNSQFLYGFVNSAFSVALFLFTLAVWIHWRQRLTFLRWLILAFLATFTYLAHLSGFVFLILAMGICWLLDSCNQRRALWAETLSFSILLPAIALQLYPWPNKVHFTTALAWNAPVVKLVRLASVLFGFDYGIDALAVILLLAALGLAVAAGKVRVDRLLLIMGLAFLAMSIACPDQVTANAGAAADGRFVPPGMVFLCLSLTVEGSRKIVQAVVTVALAAMVLRDVEIGWHLNRMSIAEESQVAALRDVAPNSRIYTIFSLPPDRLQKRLMRGNLHVSSYAAIFQQSIPNSLFSIRGAQPVYLRDPSAWEGDDTPAAFDSGYLDKHVGPDYRYVWGCNLDLPTHHYLDQRGKLISTGDVCGLWELSSGSHQ